MYKKLLISSLLSLSVLGCMTPTQTKTDASKKTTTETSEVDSVDRFISQKTLDKFKDFEPEIKATLKRISDMTGTTDVSYVVEGVLKRRSMIGTAISDTCVVNKALAVKAETSPSPLTSPKLSIPQTNPVPTTNSLSSTQFNSESCKTTRQNIHSDLIIFENALKEGKSILDASIKAGEKLPTVNLSLKLTSDFNTLNSNSTTKSNFETNFKNDMSTALKISTSRITITTVTAG